MNGSEPNVVTFNFSTRWLFVPPVTAVFTIMITGMFSSIPPIPVDPAIWGLVGLMFVLLTVLYCIFIKQNFSQGLLPVQLIAQGILLCPLSLRMGARMFQWVGVLLAICGAVVLVALYHRAQTEQPVPQEEHNPELDALPLPFAITDGKGSILSISNLLLRMVQKTRAAISGENITALLPLDKDTTSMGGKEWRILQSPMENGTQYFQLEEAGTVTAAVTEPPSQSGEDSFIEPATSFYNRSYTIKRVEEELYRIHRYKRWMSAALLRAVFQESEADGPAGPDAGRDKKDEIFNAYCRYVRSSTRETDILGLVGSRDILIVMPETQLDGAQDVVSKLLDFSAHIHEEIQGFGGTLEVQNAVAFFDASSEDLDFYRVLEKLDEILGL